MKKTLNYVFLIACILLIAIPVLWFNFAPDQISVAENRLLAEPSAISQGLSVFMKSLDDSINDRIGFRDEMVRLYRELTVNVFKGRNDAVLIGKDGWLYYQDDLPDYTGTNIDGEKIAEAVGVLSGIDAWCRERNIQFVFALCPNKSSVYSEYMPDYVRKADVTTMQLVAEAAEQAGVTVLCPIETLLEKKAAQELYMRLDTHWNVFGAECMMEEMAEKLCLPKYAFEITQSESATGDLLSMLSVESVGSRSVEGAVTPDRQAEIVDVPDSKDRIIVSPGKDTFVCYRDSFSSALMDYYAYYFEGPVFWSFAIDFDYVEERKPQYLILECVERYLDSAIESNKAMLGYAPEK